MKRKEKAESVPVEPNTAIPADVLRALGLGWWPFWNTAWNKRCRFAVMRLLRIERRS